MGFGYDPMPEQNPNLERGDLLIVDDDIASLRVISEFLAGKGYQVRSARNGSSALMMATGEPPELILLDIQMPDLDGYQVCSAIKSNPATADVPVLFVSAGNEVYDKVKGFEVGGVDYITKPYQEEEVLARINAHLTIARLTKELVNTNQHLQQEIHTREQIAQHLQRRLEEFSALHQIIKTVTASETMPQALESASETICELFGARLTLIALLSQSRQETEALVGYDINHGLIAFSATRTPLIDWQNVQQVISEGKARVLGSMQFTPLPEPIHAFVEMSSLQTALIVPLVSRKIERGLLLIGKDKQNSFFSQFEFILAETIAADIATAIENERLAIQAQQAAVNAERQRLARELHDSVTQSIYSLILLGSGWESMARQGTLKDPAESFHSLSLVGQQALRDMRLMIHQLRPSVLADKGLVKALEHRLENVEMRANIDAHLLTTGNLIDLTHETENEIYNIAQEALNNSLRHAQAQCVKVQIISAPDEITLIVEDDGRGFDQANQKAGMGLGNMEQRAASMDGRLEIQSKPDEGTRVSVWIPIRKET